MVASTTTTTPTPVPRPSAARVAGISCALAVHVVLFAVLLVPITPPLPPELATPSEKPVWIEVVKQQILPVPPVPVPRPFVKVKPAPVIPRPAETLPAPTFETVALPEAVYAPVDLPPTMETGAQESVAPAEVGRLAVVQGPPPRYPAIAIRRHWEGVVVLRILVGEDGRARVVRIERGSGRAPLDDAARKQVLKHWLFSPAMRDGRPVQAWGTVPVHFILSQG